MASTAVVPSATASLTSSPNSSTATTTTASAAATSSSTSSQYLHPEYMQLVPSSFDAKNSPLALLALTCNSIGKDPTPPPTSTASVSGHKASTSSSTSSSSSAGGATVGSSSLTVDRKDYHGSNARDSSSSANRAKSESPTTSGCLGRTGNNASGLAGGKSTNGRERSNRDHHHRTSGSGGQMKNGGGASPMSSTFKSSRTASSRDEVDGDGVFRRMTGAPDGGKPTAAAAVVSGQSGSSKLSTMSSICGSGLLPTSPVTANGSSMDFEAQLNRYAAIQHQLSMAAAAAAVASGRAPGSLYQSTPGFSLYGSGGGNNVAPGRLPSFHDAAAALAGVQHSGSLTMSGAAPGVMSAASAAGFYPPLGCMPGLGPFPPPPGVLGSSAFPSLLDPLLQQACANAAAAAACATSSASSASSLFSDYSSRVKAATHSMTSGSASACKDPFCFRCQLAAAFQIPVDAAGPFCGGGGHASGAVNHHHGQTSPSSSSAVDKQHSSGSLLSPTMPPPPSSYLPLHAALLLQHLQQQQSAAMGLGGFASGADVNAPSTSSSSTAGPLHLSPYVCSWVESSTSEFCGKRFSTSDELLRHLRTHASSVIEPGAGSSPFSGFLPSSATSMSSPYSTGLPHSAVAAQAAAALQAAFAAAAAAGYPPSMGPCIGNGSSLSGSGTSRLSPGGSSSNMDRQSSGSAAAVCSAALAAVYGSGGLTSTGGSQSLSSGRYHPYSKSSSSSSSAGALYSPSAAASALVSGLPPHPFSAPLALGGGAGAAGSSPSLPFQTSSSLSSSTSAAAMQAAAFYSPYAAALYGQRLGAAAVGP